MDTQLPVQIPFTDLPEGTVTFLFTDIEGSTQLLQRLKDKYTILLADHHRILRETFASWNGHEVDTQGDAFFVAFSRATQAAGAAVEAQRKLAEHIWPERVAVKVRMGIHTGESWTGSEGYVGMEVHRAARIAHVGNGGQVLLSEASTALVQDELPHGVSLLDLGRHLLKDINRPERICQLVVEGLPAEFPPLTSLEVLPPESARSPRKVGACPYRGLSAFQEADAQFYFGRESFIDAVELAVRTKKLVAVIVGSSGSGKSSALFAGLLPRLRKDGSYQFATFRPGSQPFYALAGAIVPLLERGLSKTDLLAETRKLGEHLAKGEVSLAQVIERIRDDSPEIQKILLLVDQMEELYTLCPDAEVQKAFVDELLASVEASKARRDAFSVIILTMRADFMGQALAHRTFADALQEASLLMGPMTRQELHTAIEKPAEMQGAAFEPGLVERILDDVGEKPGNLPLLEFTLTQLWEQQTDGWLAHADYEAMGCVEGALATYADQVYSSMESEEQELVRRAMVQLVQPGEGTEDTRRLATRDELGEVSWSLIQQLANKRLVVTGRDTQGHDSAEVVHEALIQRWGLFREWMDADRAFRAWQEQLRGNLRQWQESGTDEGALLSGVPLMVAENWLVERTGELSTIEQGFIRSGMALREKRAAEREAQQQRELEAAQKLAETERQRAEEQSRSARRLRQRAAYLAIALVAAFALAATAFLFYRQARESSDLATSRELASAAFNNLNVDPELSALLALEALDKAYTREAENALHASLPALHLLNTAHLGMVIETLTLSPDGKIIAAGEGVGGERIVLLDTDTGQVLRDIPSLQRVIFGLAFSPDGKRLASVDWNGDVKVWDVATGDRVLIFHAHDGGASRVVYSPDGAYLLTGGADATAKIWNSVTGEMVITLSGHAPAERTGSLHPGGVIEVAYTSDGKRVVTGGADGTTRIWDASSGEVLNVISGHTSEMYIGLNPEGTRLATGGADGLVKIWDITPGLQTDQPLVLINHEQPARSLAFSSDGERIAIASQDGAARVWDANTGVRQLVLVGHRGNIDDLVFSTDGSYLYTGSADGTIKTWELAPGREVFTFSGGVPFYSPDGSKLAHSYNGMVRIRDSANGEVLADLPISEMPFIIYATYSPDGKFIATASFSGIAHVWDAITGAEVSMLSGHMGRIFTIAFSPDGMKVVTASDDKTARVWDTASGNEVLSLNGHTNAVQGTAYSPDGKTIATSSWDKTVKLWDAVSGKEVMVLPAEIGLTDLAYSQDGRFLAAGSDEGAVFIWDISKGQGELVYKLTGHTAGVVRVGFSPGGNYLATPSFDGSLKVWRMDNGEEWLTFKTGIAFLTDLAFSPDSRQLATGGFEGLVRVFGLDLQVTIDLAKSRVTRSLTDAECQRYLHLEGCPTP